MTTYNTLKKIIPPDQALANQALSRSLRQVKDIFNTDLPTLSAAVSQLESNKDLTLINDLTQGQPSNSMFRQKLRGTTGEKPDPWDSPNF